MNCTKCGVKNYQGEYCNSCGSSMSANYNNCKKCNTQIDGLDSFCRACGSSTAEQYKKEFLRDGFSIFHSIEAEEVFVQGINRWFEDNPSIANARCKFHCKSSMGLFINKYSLVAVTVDYELLDGINDNQYAIAIIAKTSLFSSNDNEGLLREWNAQNSRATIVSTGGGSHAEGDSWSLASGKGLNYMSNSKLYVCYKYKRK